MTLSVVIVNYNVKYFLEQCLLSVKNAAKGIDTEIFVVDNASADGSCQMVKERFPWVTLIENTENLGFSKANNQALRVAKGEFVLVLNPDTVVEETTFSQCIDFMHTHPQAGGLSVKMIDGKGRFLPESKRALPSPSVSFYKIFGLSRLFPRSKIFARYHLGHLNPNEVNEIEILPGAFMFIRKSALNKAGLFDESFFMYGEDIDLSYRLLKCGYRNYYFPKSTIIHYKGESTKKGSINYVLVFYKAMMIFARKHFSQKNAFLYTSLIYIAIYFRAALSITKRVISRWVQPTVDAAIIASGIMLIVQLWEHVRFGMANVYPNNLVNILSVAYIAIWVISIWLSGGYDNPQKRFAAIKGVAAGSIVILIAYSLLPEDMRFSRAIILLTSLYTIILIPLAHLLVSWLAGNKNDWLKKDKRVVIVGNPAEANRVKQLLAGAITSWKLIGEVAPLDNSTQTQQLGNLNQLHEIVRVNNIDEVIFCASDLSSQTIIKSMLSLVSLGTDIKIAPPDSLSVIGSNSIDSSGDLYSVDFNTITQPASKRNKRTLDIAVALLLIIALPFYLLFNPTLKTMFKNLLKVLIGTYSWVGFTKTNNGQWLPKIKPGVFTVVGSKNENENQQIEKINMLYAKNYSITKDISIIWENIINKNSNR